MEFLRKRRKLRSLDIAWYQLASRQNLKLDSRLIRDINRAAFPRSQKSSYARGWEKQGPLESEKGRGGVDVSGGSWKLVETGWKRDGEKWKFHSRQQRTIRWKSNSTRYRATSSSSISSRSSLSFSLPLLFISFFTRPTRNFFLEHGWKIIREFRGREFTRFPFFSFFFYANFGTFT